MVPGHPPLDQEAAHRCGREPTVGPAGSEALVPVAVQSCLMNNTRPEHDISISPEPPPSPPISERCETPGLLFGTVPVNSAPVRPSVIDTR